MLIFFAFECFESQFEFSDVEPFVLIEVMNVECFGDLFLFLENGLHFFATV